MSTYNAVKDGLSDYYHFSEIKKSLGYECVGNEGDCTNVNNKMSGQCVVNYMMYAISQLVETEKIKSYGDFYEKLLVQYKKCYVPSCKARKQGNRTTQENINTMVFHEHLSDYLGKNMDYLTIYKDPCIPIDFLGLTLKTGKVPAKHPDFIICNKKQAKSDLRLNKFTTDAYYFIEFKGSGGFQHLGDALFQSILLKSKIAPSKIPDKTKYTRYFYEVVGFWGDIDNIEQIRAWLRECVDIYKYLHDIVCLHPANGTERLNKEWSRLYKSIEVFFNR